MYYASHRKLTLNLSAKASRATCSRILRCQQCVQVNFGTEPGHQTPHPLLGDTSACPGCRRGGTGRALQTWGSGHVLQMTSDKM